MMRRTRGTWILFAAAGAAACTPVDSETAEPEIAPLVESPRPQPPQSSPPLRPKPEVGTQGSLTVEVVPGYDKILAGSSGPIDVLVRIKAVDVPGHERPPLDLALVLDRSGSMAGEKLAAAKQAALETVRSLDPEDRLTFISYDDNVKVHTRREVVGNGRKLRREILGIHDGGGTALGPALRDGLDELRGKKRNEEVLAHVMLLSDGLANEGESRPEILAKWASNAFASGVATSTLGVGLDYNEDLMTKIADAGGGRYHFIESGEQVPAVLAAEFAGLSSTVARSMSLEVTAGKGLESKAIPGYPNTVDGDAIVATVGSLAASGKREMMVQMQYTAPSQGQNMALGTFSVHFRDVLDDGAAKTITVQPTIALSQDQDEVEDSENLEVTVRAQELAVAASLQAASQQVDEGAYDKARKQLEEKSESLKREAAENPDVDYSDMIEEVDEAKEGIQEAERDIQQRKLYLKKNKSRAYKKRKK